MNRGTYEAKRNKVVKKKGSRQASKPKPRDSGATAAPAAAAGMEAGRRFAGSGQDGNTSMDASLPAWPGVRRRALRPASNEAINLKGELLHARVR